MGKFKRKLSLFLAMLLVATCLVQPDVTVYATAVQGVVESSENPTDAAQLTVPKGNFVSEPASKAAIGVSQIVEESDEVWFNTGRKNYCVVSKEDFFDEELGDAYFEEDGSYTINIPEENPFFPYEVQFTYKGKVTNEWFLSPDDSVEVGGHTFYVSAYFDGTVVTQMSLNVAGDTVVVYPEEKEFTDGDGAEPLSLLPLEEIDLNVDLSSYTPAELTMVSFHSIFTGESALTDTDKVVWTYWDEDDFTIANSGDVIDLSYNTCYGGSNTYQMIVGDADQLAANNLRYIVTVDVKESRDWLIPTVYIQDNAGTPTNISVMDSSYHDYSYHDFDKIERNLYIYVPFSELEDMEQIYIGLDINQEVFADPHYNKFRVYEGEYTSASDAIAGTDITDKICCADITQTYWITIVTFDEANHPTGCLPMCILLRNRDIDLYIDYDDICERTENEEIDIVYSRSKSTANECTYITYTLYSEYAVNGIYFQKLNFYKDGILDSSDITAAYLGQYSSISEAKTAKAVNIKDSLFGDIGYSADYSQGIYFTIFVGEDGYKNQEKYQYCFKTESGVRSKNISWSKITEKTEYECDIVDRYNTSFSNGCNNITYSLYKEYAANATYYQRLYYRNIPFSSITAAYVGQFSSISEAIAVNREDIKDSLFNEGYAADYSKGIYFTVFVGEDGNENQKIYQYCFKTETGENGQTYINWYNIYGIIDNEKFYYIVDSSDTSFDNGCTYITYTLYKEYAANSTYYQRFYYKNIPFSDITAAYKGQYSSISEATAFNAEDIKNTLFSSVGYAADYSQGVYFTIFIGEDGSEKQKRYQYCFKTQTGTKSLHTPSSRTEVTFTDVKDNNENIISIYPIPDEQDSYSEFNFLTFLVEEDVDLTSLAPIFTLSNGAKLYAENSSSPEVSGESKHDFSNGAVQYTVAAEDGINSKNYWIQIVKPSKGIGPLYINSLADSNSETKQENNIIYSTREVFLDGYHNYEHDILLVNMGTDAIPSLSVELISDVIELNDYWTLKGNYDLSGFHGIEKTTDYGELENLAKIRLQIKDGIENEDGVASGTLTIKSKDTVLIVLTLTGMVGDPRIITKELPPAVKYVPYGTMIQNNNKYYNKYYGWNQVTYSIEEGELPEGMELKSNGELYGVPQVSGKFPITLKATNSSSIFKSSYAELTLIVQDNTNMNVYTSSDDEYVIEEHIGTENVAGTRDYILSNISDQLFVSSGKYGEFIDLWLNGEKLTKNVDYTYDDGSTRITIKSQTFRDKAEQNGTNNTIAAEFRVDHDEDKALKRTAQNFRIELSKPDPKPDPEPDDPEPDPEPDPKPDLNSDPVEKVTAPTKSSSSYSDDSWIKDENGWWCKTPEGSWLSNTWFQLPFSGTIGWYYFNEQGYMATGWLENNGKWYYLNPISDGTQGMMLTGWQLINGKWCFFDEEGVLVTDTWYQIPYKESMGWYYFDEEGYMATGWYMNHEQWYYLSPMLDETQGIMFKGWQLIDENWYYFNDESEGIEGALVTDSWIGDYYVDPNGVWIEEQ